MELWHANGRGEYKQARAIRMSSRSGSPTLRQEGTKGLIGLRKGDFCLETWM